MKPILIPIPPFMKIKITKQKLKHNIHKHVFQNIGNGCGLRNNV